MRASERRRPTRLVVSFNGWTVSIPTPIAQAFVGAQSGNAGRYRWCGSFGAEGASWLQISGQATRCGPVGAFTASLRLEARIGNLNVSKIHGFGAYATAARIPSVDSSNRTGVRESSGGPAINVNYAAALRKARARPTAAASLSSAAEAPEVEPDIEIGVEASLKSRYVHRPQKVVGAHETRTRAYRALRTTPTMRQMAFSRAGRPG
jgi:hypothetical protein